MACAGIREAATGVTPWSAGPKRSSLCRSFRWHDFIRMENIAVADVVRNMQRGDEREKIRQDHEQSQHAGNGIAEQLANRQHQAGQNSTKSKDQCAVGG